MQGMSARSSARKRSISDGANSARKKKKGNNQSHPREPSLAARCSRRRRIPPSPSLFLFLAAGNGARDPLSRRCGWVQTNQPSSVVSDLDRNQHGARERRGEEEREGKKARAAMATIEQWKEERERSLSCSLSDAACSFSLTGGQEQGRGSSPQRERRAPREEGNQGGGNIPCLFFFERGKRKEKRGGEVKKAKKAGRAPLGRCSLSRRQQKERKKELPSLFLFHRSLSLSTSSVLPSL